MAILPDPRSQETVSTPQSPPAVAVAGGIVLLLLVWGAGVWYFAVGRHTLFAPKAAAPSSASSPSPPPSPRAPAAEDLAALSLPPPPSPSVAMPTPAPGEPAIAAPEPAAAVKAPPDACDQAMAAAGIKLPAEFQVLAAGAYRGRDLEFRTGRNNHRASQIDVIVNSPGKPIALMLGAYDPVVWNLSWTSGTRIVAVYVGGYEPQQLAGSSKVPVLVSSYEQHTPCPYFYLGGEGLPTLNPAARRVFGKPVDMVYPADKQGSVFIGSGGPQGGFSYDRKKEPEPGPRNPLVGQVALDFAVQMGQLRLATATDSELWAKALKSTRRGDVPPVAGQEQAAPAPPPARVYIVQSREFVFPDGLYGAHSVTFVVPPGVPRPLGSPGHSAVYEVR